MSVLLQDLRYAIRVLLKNPGFTAASLFVLALGIGTITQVFSVVNRVLLQSLPYENSERLVTVWEKNSKLNLPRLGASGGDFTDWKAQNQTFENIAAVNFWGVNLTGSGEPERVQGFQVSASLFPTLGVKPSLGRVFTDDEDQPGNDHVVVLSHGLWQRRFGSDPGILGQTIILNNNSYTVIGIMPKEFQYPRRSADLWSPLALDAKQTKNHAARFLWVIARLKPNVSVEQAQAEMSSISERLEQQYPETNTGYGVWLLPLRELIIGPARQDILVSLAAAIFVLLIATANMAGILLARATARQKEIAVRIALGASRSRLVRQLLTESVLLSMIGAILGVVVAYWGVNLHGANIPDFIAESNPTIRDIHIDGGVLAFTLLISVLVGILFGLAPVLLSWRTDFNTVLKEEGRGSTGGHSHRARNLLVVAEVAFAIILLIGAGLLVKSYMRLQQVETGYNANNVLVMDVSPLASKYSNGLKLATFYQQMLERIKTLSGVSEAGAVSSLPMGGSGQSRTFTVEGRPVAQQGEELHSNYRIVSPNYFSAIGLPLLRGRDFGDQDIEGPPRVVINEAMARQYWPREEPVGKHLTIEGETAPREIIGVVGDVKDWDLANSLDDYVYIPYLLEKPRLPMTLVVRTTAEPLNLASSVRSQVLAVDRDQPVYNIRTMEKVVSDTRWAQRTNMASLAILAAISLLLAGVGMYGLISYSVNQRRHEMGIRMALGAEPKDILKLVVGHGLVLAGIGLGVGLVGAFVLTRIMSSLLFGVSATDPLVFAGVSLLVMVVAVLSSYVPARKASKIDPMTALRND